MSKLTRELGWHLERVDFEAGVCEMIDWYAASRDRWKNAKVEAERGCMEGGVTVCLRSDPFL